jgi:uncharacterized membrane protein
MPPNACQNTRPATYATDDHNAVGEMLERESRMDVIRAKKKDLSILARWPALDDTRLSWLAFPLAAAAILAAFVFFPLPLDQKAHGALHGLCAQTPSHSYHLGDRRLPFDARMTGIYGGFAVAFAYLAARGRLRCQALPSWEQTTVLGSFVVLMGIDGTNSLLLDMGRWHPYQPRNDLRLVTGLLTGLALAVAICFLLGTTLWRQGRPNQTAIAGFRELGGLVVAQAPFAAVVIAGPSWLYAPIALGLVAAATVVVMLLTLVMGTIALRRDGTYQSVRDLSLPTAVATALAVLLMAAIAGGRFWLEHWLGLPPLQ